MTNGFCNINSMVKLGSYELNSYAVGGVFLALGAVAYYLTRTVESEKPPTQAKKSKVTNRKPAPGREPQLARSVSANEERKAPAESKLLDSELLDSEGQALKKEVVIKIIKTIGAIHRKHLVRAT